MIKQTKVKLFSGLIYKKEILETAEKKLQEIFGKIEDRSPEIRFDIDEEEKKRGFTDYYCDEMGKGLYRVWISFENLREQENIYKTKNITGTIEDIFKDASGRRRINIDPGYLTASNIILFSTKNYSHRIYIADGIYAEVTLIYRNNSYNFLAWTYPDYRTDIAINFFNNIRKKYFEQLKKYD